MQEINHKLLVWARETAGITLEEASQKLNINPTHGKTAVERLTALEDGTDKPNQLMLSKMAKCYRRPLIAFYLEHPPKQGKRGQDFRKLPMDYNIHDAGLLDALIRDIKCRQYIVHSILEDEEMEPISFIASAKIKKTNSNTLAGLIQKTLDFDLSNYRMQRSSQEAFDYLRNKVQSIGVFVLLMGNLGSHHSNISPNVFRGFAYADSLAPFIVINDQDSKTAWSFTLLHELTHLWLGESGISGDYNDSDIEVYCNEVAAEILLPKNQIEELRINKNIMIDQITDFISNFASERHLSNSMVAYRLYKQGKLSKEVWQKLHNFFQKSWGRNQEQNSKNKGGPNYYILKRHRLGKSLLKLVHRSVNEGVLTPSKAGKVLGVKPRGVNTLINF